MEPPPKRLRYNGQGDTPQRFVHSPSSLSRDISPPPRRRAAQKNGPAVQKSPFQLIRAQGVPDRFNQDTVTLKDILGDPLIRECWNFNYMHDIDYILSAFDQDTRHLVKLHIVHGNWKREDPSRVMYEVSETVDLSEPPSCTHGDASDGHGLNGPRHNRRKQHSTTMSLCT